MSLRCENCGCDEDVLPTPMFDLCLYCRNGLREAHLRYAMGNRSGDAMCPLPEFDDKTKQQEIEQDNSVRWRDLR